MRGFDLCESDSSEEEDGMNLNVMEEEIIPHGQMEDDHSPHALKSPAITSPAALAPAPPTPTPPPPPTPLARQARQVEVLPPLIMNSKASLLKDKCPEWLPLPLPLPPPSSFTLPVPRRFFPAAQSRTLEIFRAAMIECECDGIKEMNPTHMSLDLGLTMGRSFRATFGPNGQLILPFQQNTAPDDGGKAHANSIVWRPTICLATDICAPSPLGATFLATLQASRNLAVVEEPLTSEGHFRKFRLPRGIALHSYQDEIHEQMDTDHRDTRQGDDEYPKLVELMHRCIEITNESVEKMTDALTKSELNLVEELSVGWVTGQMWRLGNALWGQETLKAKYDPPLTLPCSTRVFDDEFPTGRHLHSDRRQAMIAKWLEQTIRDRSRSLELQQWRPTPITTEERSLGNVADFLSEGRIAEAARIALSEAASPRLAMMVASVGRGSSRKTALFIRAQIQNWISQGAQHHFEPTMRLIYAILSGDIINMHHEAGEEAMKLWLSTEERDHFEHLDWLRRLNMHLVFHQRPRDSLQLAFQDFSMAFKSSKTSPPSPLYRQFVHHSNNEVDSSCVLYHILSLYCGVSNNTESKYDFDEAQLLVKALTPSSATGDKLDFRHSWQLATLFDALQLEHVNVTSETRASIIDGVAAQLIAHGWWEWAVFVYLHLEDDAARKATVRDVVLRHAHEKETFVLHNGILLLSREQLLCGSEPNDQWGFGLPEELIGEALAYHKGYEMSHAPQVTCSDVEERARLLYGSGNTTWQVGTENVLTGKMLADDLLSALWVPRQILEETPARTQIETLTKVFGSSATPVTQLLEAYVEYLRLDPSEVQNTYPEILSDPKALVSKLEKIQKVFARGRIFDPHESGVAYNFSSDTYIPMDIEEQEREQIVSQGLLDEMANAIAKHTERDQPEEMNSRGDENLRRMRVLEATKRFVQHLEQQQETEGI